MKTLTIRNIPDDLYKVIIQIAQRNRRSIQQQVLMILDRAKILDGKSPVDTARGIRKRLQGRKLGDTVAEIHEERNR